MLFSELYKRMCDCPELQGLWQPQEGDWYYQVCLVDNIGKISIRYKTLGKGKNDIWLPLMHQLWEMLEKEKILLELSGKHQIGDFDYSMRIVESGGEDFRHSQNNDKLIILLDVFMWSKFRKVWNGEAWVEEEKDEV